MRIHIWDNEVKDYNVIPEYIDSEFYRELKKYSEKEMLKNSEYFAELIRFFEWQGGVDFEEIVEVLIDILSKSRGKFANCTFSNGFMSVIADLIFISSGDTRDVLDIYGTTGSAHLMQNEWGRECFDSITTFNPDIECRLISGVRTYLNRLMGCDICKDDPIDDLYDFNGAILLYNSPSTWSVETINAVVHKYIDDVTENPYSDTTAILHLPAKFCYAKEYFKVRAELVENDLLSKVILLPDGACDNLNESSVIVFLDHYNEYRQDSSQVTFIDARGYISERGHFLGDDLGDDLWGYTVNKNRYNVRFPDKFVDINLKESEKLLLYGIHPIIFTASKIEAVKDCVDISMASLFSISNGVRDYSEISGYVLENEDFVTSSEGLFQARSLTKSDIPYGYLQHKGKSLIISTENGRFEMAVINNDVKFYTKPEHCVLSFNGVLSEGADLAYFAHAMLANEFRNFVLLFCLAFISREDVIKQMTLPVLFDEDDKREFVEELRRDYIQSHSSDSQILKVTSDLSHMLSLTFSTIGDKIKCLMDSELNESDKMRIKQIEHNVKYISRSIDAYHSDFLVSNPKECNINALISDYVDAWKALGRDGFELKLESSLVDNAVASLDRTQIYIMLDTILENARRHGFGKQMKDGNLVQISLANVENDGKQYVSIKVSNNGYDLPSDFTIDCYIKKGGFAGKYGRSGLGGYHVARITAQHKGILYVYSNREWAAVVEVLLPIVQL
jgi:signal transduction histidine kinase